MSHHTQNASVPQHLYGYVEAGILRGDTIPTRKLDRAVIFGVTSIPSRAIHFSILTEAGAQWARIPMQKLRHEIPTEGAPIHDLTELQSWDSHGWQFSVTQYEYLREMHAAFQTREGKMLPASYWFTLDHTENGYSLYPPEHKCYHLLLLEDGSGQIAAQPNNRIIWRDDSFVRQSPETFKEYRVMPETTWHAELGRNADLSSMVKEKPSA